jgi:ABC-type ATPase with predicted acetyltransferase domain
MSDFLYFRCTVCRQRMRAETMPDPCPRCKHTHVVKQMKLTPWLRFVWFYFGDCSPLPRP